MKQPQQPGPWPPQQQPWQPPPPRRTSRAAMVTVGVVVGLFVILAAYGFTLLANGPDTTTEAAPTPSTTPAAETDTGIPSAPTGQARADYLAAIKAVDPALVADPDDAIDAGRNQCAALDGGASNVDHLAAARFGNDQHPLDDDAGAKLNAALRDTLCPQ